MDLMVDQFNFIMQVYPKIWNIQDSRNVCDLWIIFFMQESDKFGY